jgi:hypothetical protein
MPVSGNHKRQIKTLLVSHQLIVSGPNYVFAPGSNVKECIRRKRKEVKQHERDRTSEK